MPEESAPAPQSSTLKTKFGLNWLHVLIGTIVGALLIGSGFLVYSVLNPLPKETPTTKTASKSATKPADKSSTPSAINDTTFEWKTYKNQKYGYSLKYPSTWKVDEDQGILVEETGMPYQSFVVEKGTSVTMDKIGFYVNFQGGWCEATETKTEPISLNGHNGTKYTCSSQFGKGVVLYFDKFKGQQNFVVDASIKDESVIIEEILASFRFL